jgi:hypothetical protein
LVFAAGTDYALGIFRQQRSVDKYREQRQAKASEGEVTVITGLTRREKIEEIEHHHKKQHLQDHCSYDR